MIAYREEWTGHGEPLQAVAENGRTAARFATESERDAWSRTEYGDAIADALARDGEAAKPCENKRAPALHGGGLACGEAFNCCDCGGGDCGCRYCFSCNACDACLED